MNTADRTTDTIEALRKLAAADDLRETERHAIAMELLAIEEMIRKLEAGRVEIAAYGEINAGKSALLNALLGKPVFEVAAVGGKTRERAHAEWRPEAREFSGAGATLVLVDTPGLNEAGGAAREQLARESARYADIVLFVTDGDLNSIEFSAIELLHGLHKPVVLVINKIDRFTARELDEIRASITQRVHGIVSPQYIVLAAGHPLPETRIFVEPDGRERQETRPRNPVIEDLQVCILDILEREGKAVVAINASLFATEVAERIASLKVTARAHEADALIEKFMWGKATAVAFNPVPVLDILGVVASDVTMIAMLGRIYGQPISHENARHLVNDIIGAWGVTGFVTMLTHVVSGGFKTAMPFLGAAVTAIPQGVAAAWATYVVGKAATVYFRDGGWGPKGVKSIIKDIVRHTDAGSVLAPVREKLKARIKARA
jgi:GTPase